MIAHYARCRAHAVFFTLPLPPPLAQLVVGDDSGGCTVWRRAAPGFAGFVAVASLPEHSRPVRAVAALPRVAGGAFAAGGFATGCADGLVRLYALQRGADDAVSGAALVMALAGHGHYVTSLSVAPWGALLSGSWDGTAREWDIASGACTAVLGGQENGVCVLGLPDGAVATGSTGRKDDSGRHVDYKIRVWRRAAAGAPYAVTATLSQHEQAVRDLAALPGGGFASAGNDGAVRSGCDSPGCGLPTACRI